MSGGGTDAPPPSSSNGGDFLLSLLQKRDPHHHQSTPQSSRATPPTLSPQPQPQPQQQSLALDPAVAAFGPPVTFLPPWPSKNGHDLPIPSPSPYSISPPYPHNLLGFASGSHGNQFLGSNFPGGQFSGNYGGLSNDFRRLGLSEIEGRGKGTIQDFVQMKQEEPKLMFGSFPCKIQSNDRFLNGNSLDNVVKERELDLGNRSYNGFHGNQVNSNLNSTGYQRRGYDPHDQERRGADPHDQERRGAGGRGNLHHGGNYRSTPSLETRQPPPGFPSKPRGGKDWDTGDRRKGIERNVEKEKAYNRDWSNRDYITSDVGDQVRMLSQSRLSVQLDHPGLPAGSNLHLVPTLENEESQQNLHGENLHVGGGDKNLGRDKLRKEGEPVYSRGSHEMDDLGEDLVESLLLEDESNDKSEKMQHPKSRDQNFRSDTRGQRLLSQRMRNYRSMTECRGDINRLNAPFLAIYQSLKPAEEEKAKQKQLLTLLEKLVSKEWPEARLYLYGSCANSFGVSKSDIDVCLAIGNADVNKSEILLKLADILQSDNLQNVQALTRARVPIVKLMDPVTGISCDICINNVLAVVNTKLLRDYAQIDARLQQLAFIVKHWAKSRGVNETYQGTLSSYAYVLMCIHFLQQRRPHILPCLQEMERTYKVSVDDIECAFFDQVERIRDFGSRNKETIAQLVWAFFNYWAHCHDYANDVISVRTGTLISKREKDWTRRIGNDRHLICIEDPLETSHDLGRVVDKNSIRVLREEFERAADIMQYHPNPCAALFQPYIPS